VSGKFDDFVDLEALDSSEQERLRRIHALLIEAGPPPELPAALQRLPASVTETKMIRFPQARRRGAAALLLAAALAGAAFGGGYVIGDQNRSTTKTFLVLAMTGDNALGSLRVGSADSSGNRLIDFRVNGLPAQTGQTAYYELFAFRNGTLGRACGGFRVRSGPTTAYFTIPYNVTSSSRWVVTAIDRTHPWPGRIVMT
jgi:hypothetical protein